ncbi:MAG: hypothetical protein QOI70_1216, partial [Microbacteriaceae bacterium]|nr:hypothetical protein [Microbacteriaceae bacterium]
ERALVTAKYWDGSAERDIASANLWGGSSEYPAV